MHFSLAEIKPSERCAGTNLQTSRVGTARIVSQDSQGQLEQAGSQQGKRRRADVLTTK